MSETTPRQTYTCTRCGIETGPKPDKERVKDTLEQPGVWFTINGLLDWADKYEAKQKEKP